MKIKSTLFYTIAVYSSIILNPPSAFATDDWNYWSSVSFEHKLDPKTRVIWNPVWRVRDDISETYHLATRQGVGHKVSDSLDLAAHYFYIQEKNTKGQWVEEDRLELQPTLKWDYAGFNFSDRNRFEYRVVGDDEKWRYRNLLKIAKPVEINGFSFSPYISNEIFYDLKKEELNQDRASVGFIKKINPHVTLDVYYMVRSDYAGGHWNTTNIAGTSFSISF